MSIGYAMICLRSRRLRLSSNNGHLDWKVRKISAFQSFFFFREIVLRLILKHFPHIPRKDNLIEIPVELW